MRQIGLIYLLSLLAAVAAERPIPPPGLTVADADRQILQVGLARLGASIADLKQQHGPRSPLVADVAIFHEAVRYALQYNEFFKPEEVKLAQELLRLGRERAELLAANRAPWAVQNGLVVRGYFSRIDDSVQPYGLVIPANWSPSGAHQWRLDVWFHGRSETLTELNFLNDRMIKPGEFTPRDTIVLHPYGRYLNANKFAGETDLFEALATVEQQYKIDQNRISVRGFSMGGAAAWHIGAHHAGRWAAVAPGAGFAETAEYLKLSQKENLAPRWWEEKLWRLYDATAYALNFSNVSVVAYSGEKDRQIQAAQAMERAMAAEGMTLTHIIGPGTEHRYHPDSRLEIEERVDAIMARGRGRDSRHVRFTTPTLRYNRMKWVRVDGLEQHWEPGRIAASIDSDRKITVKTTGLTAFSLVFEPGSCPLDVTAKPDVVINGTSIVAPPPASDRSWTVSFTLSGTRWELTKPSAALAIRKRHGLQGPIDDAFIDRFIIVKPTGAALHAKTNEWAIAEMNRAIAEWRRQFRGEALTKLDREITDQDIDRANLILWGDPSSNRVLARIASRLPFTWTASELSIGGNAYNPALNVPVLIFPNPLNPKRYVVLNSGFTFREYDYLTNARQTPKLPDWAVIDTSIPPDSRSPGRIATAGFFGERWEFQPASPSTAPAPPKPKPAPRKTGTKKTPGKA